MSDLAITIRQALQQKDLMKENRHMFKMVNWRPALIHALEKQYPGITKVKKAARGQLSSM